MAIFRYSDIGLAGTLPSVFSSTANAFQLDSAAADTLTVDDDAFLISTFGTGAYLQNTGAWTVNVAGQIFGAILRNVVGCRCV